VLRRLIFWPLIGFCRALRRILGANLPDILTLEGVCVHFNGFFAVAVVKLTRYLPNCIKVNE
jgi:hypothetical protein